MGTPGNDRDNDVDQLLEELLPQEASPPGIGQWQVAEVPTETAVPVEAVSAAAPEALASTTSKSTDRRFSTVQLLAFGLVAVSAIAIGGYFVGAQRSGDDAALIADVGTTSTTSTTLAAPAAPQADASAQTVTVQTDEDPDSEDDEGESASASVDDAASIDSLEAQLETVDLALVQFASGTNRLTDAGELVLAETAAALNGYPSIPVAVEVSTFTESDAGLNHGLSARQAETVIEVLLAEGVDPARLMPIGRGSATLQRPEGDGMLAFDTEHADLAEKLTTIDIATKALDADGVLTPEAEARLDQLSAAMGEHPEASVRLFGHAFAETQEASHDLSHDVLDQATTYLGSLGLDPARFTAVGMGEEPIQSGQGTSVELTVGPRAAVEMAIDQVDTGQIGFEPGTGQLTPASVDVIAEVASALAIAPTVLVEISAHTYSEETSDLNHNLSHEQGEAVMQALLQLGVASERLLVVGHGDPAHLAEAGRESYVTFQTLG